MADSLWLWGESYLCALLSILGLLSCKLRFPPARFLAVHAAALLLALNIHELLAGGTTCS